MPKILIYYEHKAREYQYCHALKYELQRRGYSVGLCHIANRHTWLYKIFAKPKVVVVGSISTHHNIPELSILEDYTDFLRGRSDYVVNIQVEQIFRDDEANFNIILDSSWCDSIYYVCWGEKRKRQILNAGIPNSHITVTGAMQLDFLRQEFQGFYKTKEMLGQMYGIPSEKKWILMISSFVWATMPQNHMKSMYAIVKNSDSKYQFEQVKMKRDISVCSLEVLLDWVDRYLFEHDDEVFIYRPHPKEIKNATIVRLIESYPGRFFFIADESVQQWISACDIIDNWISTSIVEAFFAKKQTNIIQPFPVQKDFESALLDDCKKIDTYKEFEEAQSVDQQFCVKTFPINLEQMYDYYKMYKSCAYIQVADLIEKVYHLPAISTGKSKFSFRTIFTKWFLFRIYRSFYAITRFKLSKISPVFREALRKREREVDIGLNSPDILITNEDRKICRKIKNYVRKIEGRSIEYTDSDL